MIILRPYSINVTASFNVSTNFNYFKIIGNLLLQKAETVSFSQQTKFYLLFIIPRVYLK